MADYSVTFARSARKELEKLPSSVARRVIEHIQLTKVLVLRDQHAVFPNGENDDIRIFRSLGELTNCKHVVTRPSQ